jgi:uncharacterized membrane protein
MDQRGTAMETLIARAVNRGMTTDTPAIPGQQSLILITALGCGLAGGVFFAFSSFVMSGLNRLPAPQGIAAMQSINVTAVRPAFMLLLFGTAAATVPLMVTAIRHRDGRESTLLLVGGALYLVGTIGLTIAYHVPLNDSLAKLDPTSTDAIAKWHDYVQGWTRWNHLRAASSLGAAAAFTMALLRGGS